MKKNKSSIFIAYPWSASMRSIYKNVSQNLKKKWNVCYGPFLTTEPAEQGRIEDFRNRNKQLFDRFVTNIQASDIFIADITDLNANVMIELGIAIKLNKNVLILSGVSKDKIPFDISGLHIEFYKSPEKIGSKINKFLSIYTEIKEMSFDKPVSGSYFFLPSEEISSADESIKTGNNQEGAYIIKSLPLSLPRMKDVKISVEYKIIDKFDVTNWFGFLLRASKKRNGHEPLYDGSLLVNSRYNGLTDLTYYPGEKVLNSAKTHLSHDGDNYRRLFITLDGTNILVSGEEGTLEEKRIATSEFGHIYIVCFLSKVKIKNLKILNIDTTTEII